MNKIKVLPLIMILILSSCIKSSNQISEDYNNQINLSHLNHLFEKIEMDNTPVGIIWIYADSPEYKPVGVKEEGIACVDDVARAAVVYLKHFKLTNKVTSLEKAKLLLAFILKMQDSNGLFYNFINKDHSINKDGITSKLGLNWWTARAFWALSYAYNFFHSFEFQYANRLLEATEKVLPHINKRLELYGKTTVFKGMKFPLWLPQEKAADISAVIVKGLVKLYRTKPQKEYLTMIANLSEGILLMQKGDETTFPYGAFLSWNNTWHGWGNLQAPSLIMASEVLKDKKFLNAAKMEINHFQPYLLKNKFYASFELNNDGSYNIQKFPQIAYDIRPMVEASLLLYKQNKNKKYLEQALKLSSWLNGNNPLKTQMYDTTTGRTYDGIDKNKINKNSGAESTIEALLIKLLIQESIGITSIRN